MGHAWSTESSGQASRRVAGILRRTVQAVTLVAMLTGPLTADTITFQQGDANGYSGAQDAHIRQYYPASNSGGAAAIRWGTDEPSGAGTYSYGLLRFDNIFGIGPHQIPVGATIEAATLTLFITNAVTDDQTAAVMNEITVDWSGSTVTWNNFGAEAGVQADDYGAFVGPVPLGSVSAVVNINVRSSIQAWANNPAANRGWIIRPASTDDEECVASEGAVPSRRPLLSVSYYQPNPCDGWWDCEDGNPCTVDACVDNVCVYANDDGASCDDGNPCTSYDMCSGGTCAGTPGSCPPGTACDPATGDCIPSRLAVLIAANDSQWRYFKGTQEPTPSDQTTWTRQGFDQFAWTQGTSGFGYNSFDPPGSNTNGDYSAYIGTPLPDMRQVLPGVPGYASVYIRREFDIPDVTQVIALTLKLYVDDGCVVYLNGQEVARSTSMGGTAFEPPAYNALAPGGPDPADRPPVNHTFDLTGSIGMLLAGTNVLAIQAHNQTLASRDLLILPELDATVVGNAAPNVPTDPSPPDQSTEVPANPALSVTVTDSENDTLKATFHGREVAGTVPPDFMIIHVTDTQYYSQSAVEFLRTMMHWVNANQASRNIVHLVHTGDITDLGAVESQWVNADSAMDLLETPLTGLPYGVPYAILPGNHDGAPDSTILYNKYFGIKRFSGRPYYGGQYGADNDNNFTLFSASGLDFIVIALEKDPSSAALAWADGLLKANSNRRAIVTTHYIMAVGENAPMSAEGLRIYNALKSNPNLFLMLCGHVHGEGKRHDDYQGHRVWTLLADFQSVDGGIGGWLRLLRFSPSNDKIYVQTYSPKTGTYRTGPQSRFEIDYAMGGFGPFTTIGTVSGVASGSIASLPWPGLTAGRSYQWYVDVSDGSSVATSPMWTFTSNGTGAGDMNCDGVVSLEDVSAFVFALIDPDGYEATLIDCSLLNADGNLDGRINGLDIEPFITLLTRR